MKYGSICPAARNGAVFEKLKRAPPISPTSLTKPLDFLTKTSDLPSDVIEISLRIFHNEVSPVTI
jgi:hypothetical protein